MTRLTSLVAFALFFIVMGSAVVRADSLTADLSQNLIAITSNFTGEQLVLFGAIDRTVASPTGEDAEGVRDVVVVIRGPDDEPVIVRRKKRMFGIWANNESVTFSGVPAYYFAASTRSFDQVATVSVFRRHQIGAEQLRMRPEDKELSPEELQDYKQAIIRQKQRAELFFEQPGGVRFLDNTLFRATVRIPATVPEGTYRTEVYLIRGGRVITVQSKPLYINKTGIERRIYNFAHDAPFFYGVVAVILAGLAGWLASMVFRQGD